MLINTTSSFCLDCREDHPATVEQSNGAILFRVNCPVSEKVTEISSDAALFLTIREKNPPRLTTEFGHQGPAQIRTLEITNDCNFACPVCFAESGEKEVRHMSVEKAVELAQKARRAGGTTITLTGGEPTVHPELPAIVRAVKKVGLYVHMVTNGYRLKDLEYARLLRKSGLSSVHLQFDTFDLDLHEKMRGNRFIPEKLKAFENAKQVGLKLGIITTVTTFNVHEVGNILRFGLGFAPHLLRILFQAAAHVGRYALPGDEPVDREKIIHELIDSKVIDGLTTQHCWPWPTYYPLQIGVHPDCAANFYLYVENGVVEPLDHYVNMGNVYKRLQAHRGKPNGFNMYALPLYYLLREIKPGKRLTVLRSFKGFTPLESKRGMVLVMIGTFSRRDYHDADRIKGCGSCQVTTRGHISPCIYYRPDQNYRVLVEDDVTSGIQ